MPQLREFLEARPAIFKLHFYPTGNGFWVENILLGPGADAR